MEYFHVFNRGVAKGDIFLDESDFKRFVMTMILSNDERIGLMHIWDNFRRYHPGAKLSDCKQLELHKKKPLVDIVAYCLNPNHFHFLLGNRGIKQNIEKFMQCLGISFVKYFNKKNERVGPLFQGRYKSFRIKDNGRLLYASAYVNCNSELHSSQKAEEYKWCSFPEYLGLTDFKLCNKEVILSQFKDVDEYKHYALENIREEKESRKFQKELYDD